MPVDPTEARAALLAIRARSEGLDRDATRKPLDTSPPERRALWQAREDIRVLLRTLADAAVWLEAEADHPRPDPRPAMRLQAKRLAALPDDGREGLDVDRGAMAALDLLARSMEFSVGEESYEQNAESIRAAVAMDGLAEAIARQRDSEIDFIPDDERDEFPEHLAALAADVPKTVWKGIGDFLLYGDGKPRERRTTVPGFAPAPDSGSSADKP